MQHESHAARSRFARYELAALILALGVGVAGYRWIVYAELEQTAALFIGLPTAIAIVLALLPPGPSTSANVLRGMLILLFASGPLLGEGFICVLMAAPLFFLVGLCVFVFVGICGSLANALSKRGEVRRRDGLLLGAPLLLLSSLEGVHEHFSFERSEEVWREQLVAASPEAVGARLAEEPRFEGALPFYLRLGFPRPQTTSGAGLEPGDERRILFAGGEGAPGELVLRVRESGDGRVLFDAVSDASHIAHWLSWETIEFLWEQDSAGRTRVRLGLCYQRELDPAWWFGPWERYAVGLMADYLIQELCAPREA